MIENQRRLLAATTLEDVKFQPMTPWYRGFTGEIRYEDQVGQYMSYGRLEKTGPKSLRITELPIGTWSTKYIEQVLNQMKDLGWIDFFAANTETHVWIDIELKGKV